jgi:hypothetical protein
MISIPHGDLNWRLEEEGGVSQYLEVQPGPRPLKIYLGVPNPLGAYALRSLRLCNPSPHLTNLVPCDETRAAMDILFPCPKEASTQFIHRLQEPMLKVHGKEMVNHVGCHDDLDISNTTLLWDNKQIVAHA